MCLLFLLERWNESSYLQGTVNYIATNYSGAEDNNLEKIDSQLIVYIMGSHDVLPVINVEEYRNEEGYHNGNGRPGAPVFSYQYLEWELNKKWCDNFYA